MGFVRAPGHRVRVTVNQTAIQSIFMAGGDAMRTCRELGLETKEIAMAYCPVRSGEMKNSHDYIPMPVGKNKCRYSVVNDAPHALYVHEGTLMVAPITSTTPGKYMILRPGPAHPYYTKALAVRGQGANPWMQRAMDDVLSRHGIAF